MAILNSRIILAKNIKLDKNYKNILTYTESQMVSLCEQNAVYQASNYSFIKIGENEIIVGATYATCLKANYIAFQNQYYSNKWFFAFIDSVEYNAESSTIIHYTVDECSTWRDYWTPKACFVVREHVNDDTVGKHTIPEDLETGEYVTNGEETVKFSDLCYLVNVSEWVSGVNPPKATNINGCWQAGGFYVFDNITSLVTVISAYAKEDVIKQVYIVPKFLLGTNSYNTQWDGNPDPEFFAKTITAPTSLNTYVPHNNKLKCYPYQYLLETNNNGSSNTFKYELFNSAITFNIGGCATVGGSIVSVPFDYSGGDETNMLIAGKFPTCSWSEDAYTNWLTMNAVNVFGIQLTPEESGMVAGVGMTVAGTLSALGGNPLGIAGALGGVAQIGNTMKQSYQHKIVPDSFKGNINGGDFLTASGNNGYIFYKMSIKKEMAEIIDKFFDLYGYKVNNVKVPNQTGRTNWNYVQIGTEDNIGYPDVSNKIPVPADSMEIINQVYRVGVTCWHSHSNLGDYSLSNTIVSN